MSRQFLSVLMATAALATVGASGAQAQLVGTIETDVPFAFHAGSATLPAGRYTVQLPTDMNLRVLRIASADGGTTAFVEVADAEASTTPAKTELVFDKYGDQYFLSKVFDEGNRAGTEVLPTRYEKSLMQGERAEHHVSGWHHHSHPS
jgi:hypothetical protein